jgi:hypothetical protein
MLDVQSYTVKVSFLARDRDLSYRTLTVTNFFLSNFYLEINKILKIRIINEALHLELMLS